MNVRKQHLQIYFSFNNVIFKPGRKYTFSELKKYLVGLTNKLLSFLLVKSLLISSLLEAVYTHI